MTVAFPGGETVVLHTRTPRVESGERVKDAYGALVYDESDATITGVAIWPESATEVLQSQDRTNSVYVMVIRADVEIDAIDSLTWRGMRWQIQGEAQQFHSPFTGLELQQVRINRVEG
jgi:hypothetical protein